MKPIVDIETQIRETKDTLKRYQLYGVLIDTLKGRVAQSRGDSKSPRDYLARLATAYNNRAWYGFFLKKFKNSEQDIRAGLALDSTHLYLHSNLAPALLLQGKFKEAKAEYARWKDKTFGVANDLPTFKDAFLDDLKVFEEAGIIPKARLGDVAAIRGFLN